MQDRQNINFLHSFCGLICIIWDEVLRTSPTLLHNHVLPSVDNPTPPPQVSLINSADSRFFVFLKMDFIWEFRTFPILIDRTKQNKNGKGKNKKTGQSSLSRCTTNNSDFRLYPKNWQVFCFICYPPFRSAFEI